MFVLGDVRIHPKIDRTFPKARPLGVYLQLYNAALDTTRAWPSLKIRYRVTREGKAVKEITDEL